MHAENIGLLFWLSTGTGTASTPSQSSSGDGEVNDIVRQHQARLQAAAAAASIYGRSFVYPSVDTFTGYALLFHVFFYALSFLMACRP